MENGSKKQYQTHILRKKKEGLGQLELFPLPEIDELTKRYLPGGLSLKRKTGESVTLFLNKKVVGHITLTSIDGRSAQLIFDLIPELRVWRSELNKEKEIEND